jgi:PAS domain S-box-containing protein
MAPPLDDDSRLSAETELRALVEAFPDAGYVLDAEGRYVEVLSSPESEQGLHRDPGELLDSRVAEVFDDETAELFMSNVRDALGTGELQSFEYSLDVAEGERWFEARLTPVDSVDGGRETDYVVYVARDVTDWRESQREIARQRGYMRQMLDSLDDVFYALDREGELVDWNRAVETVSGYTADELSACAIYDIFDERAGERLHAFVAEVLETGSARRVTEIETKSGTRIPYEFVAGLFDDPRGEDLVVGIGRDVSERVEREEQVRVFGRVLRHNMRNKMTVIEGTAETLDRESDGAFSGATDRIRSAAADLTRLTEKAHDATDILLHEGRREPIDIDAVARGVVSERLVEHGRAQFAYSGDRGATAVAIPAIRQAIAELVENAVVHGRNPDSDGSGRADDPEVRVSVERRTDVATVTVSDDGPGLPDHEANIVTEEREMSPTFHASGMGLWLVRWIVERSHGDLELVDDGRSGTTITIELSRVNGPPPDESR